MRPVVLFISQRDNARSILAKLLLRRLGQDRYEISSCGIKPENRVFEPMRKLWLPIMVHGFHHMPRSLDEALHDNNITHIIPLGVNQADLIGFGIAADDLRLVSGFSLKDPQLADLRPSEVSSLCHDLFCQLTKLIQKWVLAREADQAQSLDPKAA